MVGSETVDAWTETPRPRRQRGTWTFAPAALAALVALAALGCGPITPIGSPTFIETVADLTFPVDEEIRDQVLPAATGGGGSLTYSLGPEIPAGLAFDAASRTLSGTPTATGNYPMTYRVEDTNGRSAELAFSIETYSLIRSIVAAIEVAGAAGVPRFEDVPEPGDGPSVAVVGNHFYVAGGSVFLDIEPEPGATVDKLILSIEGESFGYYEIDVPDAATSHRLVGQVLFDVDPPPPGCLEVSAVDAGGAVGPPTCHFVIGIPTDFSDVQVTVSWDTDADLDLHVADPNGHEVYFGADEVESGGVLFPTSDLCEPDNYRNERIAWTEGTPPPGRYEVRLSHYRSCGAEETNYVVSVYNHGTVTTFTGTFTGDGEDNARGTGVVITTFHVPGDAPPEPANAISSTYRGSGDQVFVLNPNGEALDQTLFTLDMNEASAEVYVIATAGNYHVDPHVERIDLREAAAKGLQPAAPAVHQPEPRPALGDQVSPRLKWITEFNNFDDGPPVWEGSADPGRMLSDNTDAPAPYQYNTGTWRTSHAGGLEFRLGSINLYHYVYAPGRLARPGPYLHPLPVFNDRTQPPHSNMYTTLGRQSGTLRLSITAESENRITVVVKE